jgi:hypothetical protein
LLLSTEGSVVGSTVGSIVGSVGVLVGCVVGAQAVILEIKNNAPNILFKKFFFITLQ